MNILVTGGCGFIGINLIQELVRKGDTRILVVDNLSVGTREDLGRVTEFQEIGTSDLEEIQRSEGLPHSAESIEQRGKREEDRDQRTEDRDQRTDIRDQRTDIRGQRSEDRRQRSEVGGHPGEMRCAVVNEFHPSTISQSYGTGRAGRSESEPNGIELVVGDIRDEALAMTACRGMDAVVHLAANTGVMPSIANPIADCKTNVLGTLNYLDACRHAGVKRFVFASSGAPLGEKEPPIHEEMVARPISPYGASKLAGEAYCSAFFGSYGVETVTLRFGNVYGPRSSHKGSVVAKFIRHILAGEDLPIYGDGAQTRDFIYVADLIQAILLSLNKSDIGGEVFQIATHREHTVLEVAEALNGLANRALGKKSSIIYEQERKGEIRRNYSDISKARNMLGFEPEYDLERGLEETFRWFLNPNFR